MKLMFAVACCLMMLSSSGVARAHELQQNNGISGVLHVAPTDKPISGKPLQLEFAFGDPHDAFSLADCDCQLSIAHGQKVIAHPALQTNSKLSAVAEYTFSAPGLYEVIIAGNSHDGAFPTFHLDFGVTVAPGQGTAEQRSAAWRYELLIAVVAVAGLWSVRRITR